MSGVTPCHRVNIETGGKNPLTHSVRKAPTMAKAAKKKAEKKVEKKAEPELSPREKERQELVNAQATEFQLTTLWDNFADDVQATSAGVKESMAHSVNGALSLGAKIVEFSKDESIQKQLALANLDRRGRPWMDYSWVADQLEKAYDGIPTAKHLADCARGYIKALETGQLESGEKNLRKLLGWTPSAVPTLTGKTLEDAELPRLPKEKVIPPPPKDPKDKKDVDPRAELVTILHDANETIQYWIDACKEKELATDGETVQEMVAVIMVTLETI